MGVKIASSVYDPLTLILSRVGGEEILHKVVFANEPSGAKGSAAIQ